MIPQSSTMPEAKFRTVKKRETPLRSIRTSEFAAELREQESMARQASALTEIAASAQVATVPPPAVPVVAVQKVAVPVAVMPVAAASAVAAPVAPIVKKSEVTAEAMPAKKSKKEESKFGLVSFWPLAVGLFLSGFATEWHGIATQAGLWVVRFTFPFAMLATHREIGIDAQMASSLPQMAIYAQMPIDGIFLILSLLRTRSLKAAILHVTAIHAVCAFVLWLVATTAK